MGFFKWPTLLPVFRWRNKLVALAPVLSNSALKRIRKAFCASTPRIASTGTNRHSLWNGVWVFGDGRSLSLFSHFHSLSPLPFSHSLSHGRYIAALGCWTYSMSVAPLYDTLGSEACIYILNQARSSLIFVIYLIFELKPYLLTIV